MQSATNIRDLGSSTRGGAPGAQGLLAGLGVQTLGLPAAASTVGTWMHGFGFVAMPEEQQRAARAELRILVFPGAAAPARARCGAGCLSADSDDAGWALDWRRSPCARSPFGAHAPTPCRLQTIPASYSCAERAWAARLRCARRRAGTELLCKPLAAAAAAVPPALAAGAPCSLAGRADGPNEAGAAASASAAGPVGSAGPEGAGAGAVDEAPSGGAAAAAGSGGAAAAPPPQAQRRRTRADGAAGAAGELPRVHAWPLALSALASAWLMHQPRCTMVPCCRVIRARVGLALRPSSCRHLSRQESGAFRSRCPEERPLAGRLKPMPPAQRVGDRPPTHAPAMRAGQAEGAPGRSSGGGGRRGRRRRAAVAGPERGRWRGGRGGCGRGGRGGRSCGR